MIFRQVIHEDLGCASYFVGDKQAGVAAVIDPRFEIEAYLGLARCLGVSIGHVLETHNHADHVSGHGRLAAATGATIHVHRLVEPEFEHEPFDHGDRWQLGSLRIEALHTPGHRPEHTCFLLTDTRRAPDPWALLSGDSLFVGDVARPDLAVERVEGARGVFRSLHAQLLSLPDYVEVWPGHLGGSMCGGPGMDLKVASTIGFERAHNPMLQIDDERAFVDASVSSLGAQPPNFRAIVELNRGPLLRDGVEVRRLSPAQLAERQRAGALVVDVRADREFDHAHVPGSISIPLWRGGFGTKLAWIAPDARELAFVGAEEADGDLAGSLAAAVGLASPVHRGGTLAGGWASWTSEDRPRASLPRITVEQLVERLGGDRSADELDAGLPAQVLDVREAAEFEAGHIPGSVNVPWHELTAIPSALAADRPTLVVCASGQRAGTAASMLRRLGADVVHVTGGGVSRWAQLGGRLEASQPARKVA